MKKIQIYNNSVRSFISYINELIESKNLVFEFFKRDIKILYIQSFAAPLFYLVLPIIQSSIFSILIDIFSFSSSINNTSKFSNFINIMPIMIFWNLITYTLNRSSGSYIYYYKIINKIYFPRLIFFISPFLIGFFNFSIQFLIFFIIYLIFHGDFNLIILIRLLTFPFVILYSFFLCLSLSILIASVSIKYRDIVYILNFVLQFGLFLSPVLYSLSDLSGLKLIMISLNPFSAISETIRWIFFNNPINNLIYIIYNLLTIIFLFLFSFIIFRKQEKIIADYV
jgi:lipopolysaccharide transport system permease protein